MQICKLYVAVLFFLFIDRMSSQSQSNMNKTGENNMLINRQPAVAGQFYPAEPDSLKAELKQLFASAVQTKTNNTLAIISPHAGYVFSGTVAASAFNQIDAEKNYKHIFILASSHRMHFEGASIYTVGNYETPLGEVKVDIDLAKKLVKENHCFNDDTRPHASEHSLEVQLPFLQFKMKTNFKIIPIILGTDDAKTCMDIAFALKPYFNDENLFIISTDFSHYPTYKDATLIDKITANAIMKNSPEALLATLKSNNTKGISQLATSLCGWTSVLTLLYMTEGKQDIEFSLIDYHNSGDSKYGDKSEVVGYNALAVSQKKDSVKNKFSLSETDKHILLDIARNTLSKYIREKKTYKVDSTGLSDALLTPCGAFVSLHESGNLRGCIGRFEPDEPLFQVIQEMAIAAATEDSRFSPVSKDELDSIDIEISVLTPMQKIKSIDEIQLGKHGIYIKKGYHHGTFLPQVATETGWNKEEFLGHCARDKAGLSWDEWKTADIFIYEAIIFREKN